MRHLQTKPNSSSSKGNVGSGSGAKVTNVSQKTGATKRIHNEPPRSSKKRKSNETPTKGKCSAVVKNSKESDTDKTQKHNPAVVKKSSVKVKRIKKPNEKFKKVDAKTDKKANILEKVLKRCKVFEKIEDNDGPPTLCETFSRITTMVAETVINEKENQRLTESLLGKVKKEMDNSGAHKSKGDANPAETVKFKKGPVDASTSKAKSLIKKAEPVKKVKTALPKSSSLKMKSDKKKSKVIPKKSEKATLDNTENLVKVLKDDEIPLAFGKGIGTRRKSTAGSIEGEQKLEVSDAGKVKGLNITKGENSKKKSVKSIGKKVSIKKEKPKAKVPENQSKKAVEEGKKTVEKGEHAVLKDSSQKKIQRKEKLTKAKTTVKKQKDKSNKVSKKKTTVKEAKTPKSKFGSETDGSNSDELTLNIIQKKTKKRSEAEKYETAGKSLKVQQNTDDVKNICSEEKLSESEKTLQKSKKLKIEKDEKNDGESTKKPLDLTKDRKKSKETESDTDEDMELKRIMAKKLGRDIKAMQDLKKKKTEPGKNTQDSEQRAKRLRLFGFWSGPKRHRVASLNALAKVHCLYENESKGVLAEIEKMAQVIKPEDKKMDKREERLNKTDKKNSGSARKMGKDSDAEKVDGVVVNKRILRGTPGTRGAGKHWDMFGDSTTSISSASSDESHSDTDRPRERKLPLQPSYRQKMLKKEDGEKEESAKIPKRRRNNEIGLTMDLKDMVVRKRMASLNASAILAASYSSEKRSNRKDSSETSTEDCASSLEDNDKFLSDEGESVSNKADYKKVIDREKSPEEKKEVETISVPECAEYRHKKHFWKTKVESLKKSSKEKRNSPSPILADFGLKKDLSTTILEKEKNDEMNDDKEKDKTTKIGYPPKKFIEGKLKGKTLEGKFKNFKTCNKETPCEKDIRKKYSKRKLCEDEVKNISIEKMSGKEKSDEYEYKSDSDNGQRKLIELRNTGGSNKKVAVIVNQDTDVTITGVYLNSTRSTHHEGFCSIAGMQYRISSTSHTQTEATAVLKTSTASEQTPPPTEPTNCTSPRGHKSYTPLSALSNMQPPAGAPPHTHLPPPPHHHHHLCGMGQHRPPPDHYLAHGPISHQRPISPLARRHGCSSAFTTPHCSSHSAPGGPSSPPSDGEAFPSPLSSHGYFQPAGPLIHHHSSNLTSIKGQNLSGLDPGSTPGSQAPASSSEDGTESSARTGENSAPPSSAPPAAHHMGYPRGYPPYQGGYYQGSYYPPPQSAHYQPPPPTFHQHYHHHQDLCYPPGYPPSSYPPPPGSYRRFLQPPPNYYSPELTYGSSGPPPPQDHGTQQMVVPGGSSSSYSAPLDPYPPPAPYHPGYSPGPGPACYSHPPSSRNLAFIEQTYQSCPCPMQLCPKNVHIGPLTGECKRPDALPLPPVALQLPQEPPGAAGPPSPARGSAGMPPQPSPLSNCARPNWDGRVVKSGSDIKWEESKTNLELKPLKYKTETINCLENEEHCNLPNGKHFVENLDKCLKPVETQWNEMTENKREKDLTGFAQGLLAISSKEVTLLSSRTQELTEQVAEYVRDVKKIKTETLIPLGDGVDRSSRKRNVTGESSEGSPKKRKLMTKLQEIIVSKTKENNNNSSNKKKKKRGETPNENLENKVKKVQKSSMVRLRDENSLCGEAKALKKNQKNINSKAKLLKDRNETVEWRTGGLTNGIKGTGKKEKKGEETLKAEAEKIIGRRKSNQDRSGAFPEAEAQSVRKSKSCSPTRSKAREQSPVRLLKDDIKRKQESARKKAKGVLEHSKTTKRKTGLNGTNGAKGGKHVSLLSKSSQSKSKKSKSDYPLAMVVLKKFSSKKSSGSPRSGITPKWSNGWSWDSESFDAKVYLTNDEPPVMRKCYTAMRHVEGDVIHPKDCILLKAGPRRIDLPFVAKVAALWENPDDGEMMVSLLWYYRPEHTDQGRQPSDQQDEIFASRHKDINSVACIEDKCFVLTYNEYCRYRKKVKRVEEGLPEKSVPVPRLEQPYFRFQRQPPCVMAPDMVFFCRRVYDFRQRRLLKNPT